jgi:heat shock protein HspQ
MTEVRRASPRGRAKPRSKKRARTAKFGVGSVVRHRFYPFRGVVFDIDPVFNNTEEWWLSIPAEMRPDKNQPFYHLLAENEDTEYIAYVSEQNLLADKSGDPLRHPKVAELFIEADDGSFKPVYLQSH